ncbi:MAG TPA: adenylosuccinate lyase, partial [bacterium]|nr:adenylosuccinate lyase [bacterium]
MIERYYSEKMKKIWGEGNYYGKWKEVEAAVLRVRGEERLAEELKGVSISAEKIKELEKELNHELNAFLAFLELAMGERASAIHKGLTSSDVMDTARAMQIRESLELIEEQGERISALLKEKAEIYKDTLMCGRTHGQVAEPITLGYKLLRFQEEMERNLRRIEEAKPRLFSGKISGAVGTYSLVSPDEEKKVLELLGLNVLGITSQILPRDIFAEYLFLLALVSNFAASLALEIRLLSQDGIRELAEPFTEKQTGSSAMPHKKNPVLSERICGLARLAGAHLQVALGNMSLWNERDISHSSNERIILEESSALTSYILDLLEYILKGLVVFSVNMEENIKEAGARIYSSGALKLLLDMKIPRSRAYGLIRGLFSENLGRADIAERLARETGLDPKEIKKVLMPEYYLKNIREIFKQR